MEKKKIDQRVRLTQHLLKNALVQLMQEQHISKISIRAICEFAGINRSTFYVHYTDQYDLLKKVEQEVLDNLELFKALLSENCDFAFQKDLVALAQIISSQQNQLFDLRTQEYIKIFGFTGTISMLQKWLNDGANESPAQMAEFIIQIVYYGISGLKKNTFNP